MSSEFMLKASRLLHKTGLQIRRYSPEILMVAGIGGTIVSTVLACKATTKIEEILEDKNYKVNQCHEVFEKEDPSVYSEEDYKKDLTIIYAQTGIKIAKLYAPAVILGAVSITSIVAGHNIIRKRNAALVAAYALVDKGFKDYRKNVVERFGENVDKELRYNIKAKEFETETTDEKGNKKVKKEVVDVVDKNSISMYARFFDETCPDWTKDPEANLLFLRMQQAHANDRLRLQGYLFLNDVYKMLGMQPSKAGFTVGWLYDEKDPKRNNFVDFGIYDINNEVKRNFVNGYERSILLDFNVDSPDILNHFSN